MTEKELRDKCGLKGGELINTNLGLMDILSVKEGFMSKQIVTAAKALCIKFVGKVRSGKARSTETYAECIALLEMINESEQDKAKNKQESGV